jgi:hypothetical protein
MHFEYAVEPEAIGSNWENFRYLIEKFGFDRGRLISRFPKKWEKKVIHAAKAAGMREVHLASLVEKLKYAKQGKFLDLGRPYEHALGWLENAIEQDEHQPFHAIVATEKNANDSIICIDEVDEDHALLKRNRDIKVARTGEEIAKTLAPLLWSAKTVLFIDPYFDVSNSRNRETLKCCLETFATNVPRSLRCEVHFGDMDNNVSTEVIEREATNWLVGVIPDGMSVIFYAWNKKENGENIHDRFLLTQKGGVKLGGGFIANGNHQTVNISLLDFDFCECEHANFKIDATVYDLSEPVVEVFSDGRVVRV